MGQGSACDPDSVTSVVDVTMKRLLAGNSVMPPCQSGDCRIGDNSGSGIHGFTGDRSVPRMESILHLESW